MEIVVLHNPAAGDRDLPQRKLRDLLRRAGYRPKFFSLKEPLWKKKHAFGQAELIVVAGGDGSVRKAVLRLHDRGLPFAILPLGTANNICTSLGISGEPRTIIDSWRHARPRNVDLGIARGPWGEKWFIESAGLGLIARAIAIMSEVGATAEHRPEWREDRLHRDASVVQALAYELRPSRISVAGVGAHVRTDDFLLLEVMNINRVGPGLNLAPAADPSDGLFDVVTATDRERKKLNQALASAVAGASSSLLRKKTAALRLTFQQGEFRLDDKIVLRLGRERRRSRARKVTVEIAVRPEAIKILGA